MSDELERLQASRAKINDRIWAIEGKRRAAEHSNLLGKHFKYRNSYSCPNGEADKWWLYIKITKVDQRGDLKGFQFQTDKYGKLEIEADHRVTASILGTPITAGEFNRAWKSVQRRIRDAQP